MPDLKNLDLDVDETDIPEEPGPALMGKTPVLGTVRRKNGIPVARDEAAKKINEEL